MVQNTQFLMKKTAYLFSILFISIQLTVSAQNLNTPSYGQTDQYVTDFFRQVRSKDTRKVSLGSIKGSPYFEEEFIQGTIYYKDEPQDQTVFLRHNAYADEIEMTANQYQYQTDQAVVKSTDLSCTIGNDRYVYLPYVDKTSGIVKMGYLIELYKNNEHTVFLNKSKVYMEATQARTGLERSFPPRFVDDYTYYYNTNGDTPIELKLYKSKLREIFSNKERFNSFTKRNSRSKENTSQWLIDLFEYMHQ